MTAFCANDVQKMTPTRVVRALNIFLVLSTGGHLRPHQGDLTIHSAFECGLGMAANIQVAAALEPVQRAIDFGLENMVNELIVPHIPVRNGRVAVPDGPGLGVEPNWDEIHQLKMDTTAIA